MPISYGGETMSRECAHVTTHGNIINSYVVCNKEKYKKNNGKLRTMLIIGSFNIMKT